MPIELLEGRGFRNVKNIARPVEVFAAHWEDRRGGKETPRRQRGRGGTNPAASAPGHGSQQGAHRGLKPFESVDAAISSVETQIAEAMDRLRDLSESSDKRLLVILAASGAGKSSFLRAGLLPRLARDARRYLTLCLSFAPNAARSTAKTGCSAPSKRALPARSRAELRATIRSGAEAVRALLGEIVGDRSAPSAMGDNSRKRPTVVMAIDQAEELFRANAADEGSALLTLVRELEKAATIPSSSRSSPSARSL